VAALFGAAISVYLTQVHYAAAPLFCPPALVFNCGTVLQSAFSLVPGTAVAITIPGLAWFAGSALLAVAAHRAAGRSDATYRRLAFIHLAWSGAGVLGVLYLVFAELVVLHQVCEWCTVVHVLMVSTFLLALQRVQRLAPAGPSREYLA